MNNPSTLPNTSSHLCQLCVRLPGPDRRRQPTEYRFHVRYRTANQNQFGCLMTWEVQGGRENYQIHLENCENGNQAWHCTCADAVYRGSHQHHQCKHVQGLMHGLDQLRTGF